MAKHSERSGEASSEILYRVAEVIMSNPDGTIRDVIFPVVNEETFENLVAEKKSSGPQYQLGYFCITPRKGIFQELPMRY